VGVTDDALRAISAFRSALKTVKLPSERRTLTLAEQRRVMRLVDTAKATKASVDKAVDAGKEAVFNHLDLTAPDGDYDTDKNGHLLVKQELPVRGTDKRFTRELREKAPSLAVEDLHRLMHAGKISRDLYERITYIPTVPRVVDEDALFEALKADPKLVEVLSGAITPGEVTSSFNVRPLKKGDQNG
jgi:hypothetical protein